jgi:glycosyltransferase involved in cell wall biosynthesis
VKITVIILVHDRTGYLAECVQSVLDQSYPACEIIFIDSLGDDGYLNDVLSRMGHFDARCFFRSDGKTTSSLVNEAVQTSNGDVICLLDANDIFHKEKLQTIAEYFGDNSAKNAVCHAHFVLSSSGKLLSLWRPPSQITFENLLLNGGLSISDLAVRRSVVQGMDVSHEYLVADVELMDFAGRLLLSGVTIGGLDRALGYRRVIHTSGQASLMDSLESLTGILDATFNDPRCPEKVLGLREAAMARVRLKSAYEAFVNGDGALGRELLRSSIYLDRSILDVQAYRFFFFLIVESVRDGGDHPDRINRVFDQLPPEMMWMTPYRGEVIARGFVLRGMRAVLWGRREEGTADLAEAARLGCRIDPYFFYVLANELMDCEAISGYHAVDSALRVLTPHLEKMSSRAFVRRLKGEYFANRAFREFEKGRYSIVLRSIRYAIFARPVFMINRGLLATLFRSLGRMRYQAA